MRTSNELRLNELAIGDTLCYHKKGVISFFIRLFTNSKYSHTSFYVARNLVSEALAKGYCVRDIKESLRDAKEVIVKRPKLDFDRGEFNKYILNLIYTTYEFDGLFYEAIKQISPKKHWVGDREAVKDIFCSKANAWVFYNVFKMSDYANWYEITPRDIVEDFKNFDTYKLVIYEK